MLERPDLLATIWEAVLSRKLTLLSAPTGAGKTMTVAALLHQHPDQAIGWITLDEEDNDSLTFMSVLVAALERALPGFGRELASLLESGAAVQTPLRRLMAQLINELLTAEQKPIILVLDDLQEIKNANLYDALDYLIDHLPHHLHLVATTRTDPPLGLARLRIRGELAEFRLPDLRFNEADAARYLNQEWGLNLSDGELAALYKQTEGWIASIHLLASRMVELSAAERTEFVDRFSRANRLIFDLLAEEVLNQQPEDLRRFLLETSILRELTPSRCEAIMQSPEAARLLDLAYRRNLFLVAIEESTAYETPYRYHTLFGNFLQKRLLQERPADWVALHRRAAEAETLPERAIAYYLEGEMWPEAAAALVELGKGDVIRRFVRAPIVDDILRLPEPIWQSDPWLRLILGVYYAERGEAERSGEHLQQALSEFRARKDELGEIEVLVAECWRLGGLMNPELLDELGAKIDASPELFRPDQLAGYHAAAQWWYQRSYDWPQVTHHVQAGLNLARETGDLGAIMTVAGAFGPELLLIDKGMAAFEQFAISQLNRDDLPYTIRMFVQLILAYVRFYQGQPHESNTLLLPVEAFLERIGGQIWVDGHVSWLRISLAFINHGGQTWQTALEEAIRTMGSNPINTAFLPGLYYFEGRAAWQQNRPDLLAATVKKIQTAATASWFPLEDPIRLLMLEGLMALLEERFGAAEEALQEAADQHRKIRHTMLLHDPRLALALLYHRWNRPEISMKILSTALADIRAQGTPGMVLQEGVPLLPLLEAALAQGIETRMLNPLIDILREAGSPRPVPIPGSAEQLSPREMEVLRFLAAGASNRKIAEELVVTVRTAKAHVSSILSKLGVSSRSQAAARARELRII